MLSAWSIVFIVVAFVHCASSGPLSECMTKVTSCPNGNEWDENKKSLDCSAGQFYVCMYSVEDELYEGCTKELFAQNNGKCPRFTHCKDITSEPVLGGEKQYKDCDEKEQCPPKSKGSSYSITTIYNYPKCIGNTTYPEIGNVGPSHEVPVFVFGIIAMIAVLAVNIIIIVVVIKYRNKLYSKFLKSAKSDQSSDYNKTANRPSKEEDDIPIYLEESKDLPIENTDEGQVRTSDPNKSGMHDQGPSADDNKSPTNPFKHTSFNKDGHTEDVELREMEDKGFSLVEKGLEDEGDDNEDVLSKLSSPEVSQQSVNVSANTTIPLLHFSLSDTSEDRNKYFNYLSTPRPFVPNAYPRYSQIRKVEPPK